MQRRVAPLSLYKAEKPLSVSVLFISLIIKVQVASLAEEGDDGMGNLGGWNITFANSEDERLPTLIDICFRLLFFHHRHR